MSFRKDILRTVQASPGLTLHEIAAKLRARNKMAHVSTQLSIEFGKGNVRRKGACRAYTYFPTALTQAARGCSRSSQSSARARIPCRSPRSREP